MFYLKLFSFFHEKDIDEDYIKKNKILKYFSKPKLKKYIAEDTVETLLNHFLKEGQILNENDIVSINYAVNYDKKMKRLVLEGSVFIRGTFRGR
jgi:hypothetical protein